MTFVSAPRASINHISRHSDDYSSYSSNTNCTPLSIELLAEGGTRTTKKTKLRSLRVAVEECSSAEITSSSSCSDDVTAMPATLVTGKANRAVSLVPQNEYETTDDEDEEDESDCSSMENSVEFVPLAFVVINGNGNKVASGPKMKSFRANQSEASEDELSLSEAPLAVQISPKNNRPAAQRVSVNCASANVLEEEVEEEEEEEQPQRMNEIIVKNLVRRLRNPNNDVKASEFAEVEWDDPNLEKELAVLKQIARYIEVKETMIKSAKEGSLRSQQRIEEKIREAVMTLPEVTLMKVKRRPVGQANIASAAKEGRGFSQETQVGKVKSDRMHSGKANTGEKEANMDGFSSGKKKIAPNSLLPAEGEIHMKEARMKSQSAKKSKMTDSMIFAAVEATKAKEVTFSAKSAEKKKKGESLIVAESSICAPKEAVFSEKEKRIRKKRAEHTHRTSIVMNSLPDIAVDEIKEPESESAVAPKTTDTSTGNSHKKTVAPKPKKKRGSGRNRSMSLIVESLPDEPNEPIPESDTAPASKNTTSAKKLRPLKKRRTNNLNNRSITFSEVLDDGLAGEMVEKLDDQEISTKSRRPDHTTKSIGRGKTRRHRPGGNISRSNLCFEELPSEPVNSEIKESTDAHLLPSATASTTRSSKRSPQGPVVQEKTRGKKKVRRQKRSKGMSSVSFVEVEETADDAIVEESTLPDSTLNAKPSVFKKSMKKPRKMSTLHKSRELEFSLLPDELPTEVKDADADAGLLQKIPTSSNGSHGVPRPPNRKNSNASAKNRKLEIEGKKPRLLSQTKRQSILNHSVSAIELPDNECSFIPDTVRGKKSSAINNIDEASQATNARKLRARRKSNLNRSQPSFLALPEEEIVELKENVDETIKDALSASRSIRRRASDSSVIPSNNPLNKRHSSTTLSVASIPDIVGAAMPDNVENPAIGYRNHATLNGIKTQAKERKKRLSHQKGLSFTSLPEEDFGEIMEDNNLLNNTPSQELQRRLSMIRSNGKALR